MNNQIINVVDSLQFMIYKYFIWLLFRWGVDKPYGFLFTLSIHRYTRYFQVNCLWNLMIDDSIDISNMLECCYEWYDNSDLNVYKGCKKTNTGLYQVAKKIARVKKHPRKRFYQTSDHNLMAHVCKYI